MRECVSFKEKERYLYEHAKQYRSFSTYVKDLIEEDYKKKLGKENKDKGIKSESSSFIW